MKSIDRFLALFLRVPSQNSTPTVPMIPKSPSPVLLASQKSTCKSQSTYEQSLPSISTMEWDGDGVLLMCHMSSCHVAQWHKSCFFLTISCNPDSVSRTVLTHDKSEGFLTKWVGNESNVALL